MAAVLLGPRRHGRRPRTRRGCCGLRHRRRQPGRGARGGGAAASADCRRRRTRRRRWRCRTVGARRAPAAAAGTAPRPASAGARDGRRIRRSSAATSCGERSYWAPALAMESVRRLDGSQRPARRQVASRFVAASAARCAAADGRMRGARARPALPARSAAAVAGGWPLPRRAATPAPSGMPRARLAIVGSRRAADARPRLHAPRAPARRTPRRRAPVVPAARGAGLRVCCCSARMAPRTSGPERSVCCAAALLPSPTIAASTMAPLISRRRPCGRRRRRPRGCAAARGRRRGRRRGIRAHASAARPRCAEPRSPARRGRHCSTARTSAASASSASASSRCSSVTCAWPARARSPCARARVAARSATWEYGSSSSAIDCGIASPGWSGRGTGAHVAPGAPGGQRTLAACRSERMLGVDMPLRPGDLASRL